MKNIKYIILFLLAGMVSCDKGYLDLVPDNVATIDNAFANRFNAEKFLYTCYSFIPQEGNTMINPALSAGDETWYPDGHNKPGIKIKKGEQNITSPVHNLWGNNTLRVGIRDCDIFLNKIDEVLDMESQEISKWKAEVKFLKAYYHFYLFRMYGPIVLEKEMFDIATPTDGIKICRNTVDECVDYMVLLLDEAIPDLPLRIEFAEDELGRVTRAAAASLKARLLMFSASPLFNGNSVYDDFVDNDGNSLFPSNYSSDKWVKAAEACKEAIDICHEAGVALYQKDDYINPFVIDDVTTLNVALRQRVTEKWNKELIWGHTAGTGSIQIESMPRLFAYENTPVHARHCAPLRIAEMFYSENGVPIDEDISWDFANRYRQREATSADKFYIKEGETTANLNFNREPRFYSDLAFDRGLWFGADRMTDDTDQYFIEARNGEFASHVIGYEYSVTGYWPKKLVHIKSAVSRSFTFKSVRYPFPIIRLADIYLYYAEALNESKETPDAQVYEHIDLVRERAGLDGVVNSWKDFSNNPDKPSTKSGMRSIIQQERMIEMSFEGARFWDLRRWKLAKDYMKKPIKAWNIMEKDPEDYYSPRILYYPSFSERDYLWPIRENDILDNPNVVQNPGW